MYKQLGKGGMLCAYRPGMGSQGRGGCHVHIMGDGGAIYIYIWVVLLYGYYLCENNVSTILIYNPPCVSEVPAYLTFRGYPPQFTIYHWPMCVLYVIWIHACPIDRSVANSNLRYLFDLI